jgi:hypothetical protein
MRPGKADAPVASWGMPMDIAICRTCDERMTPSETITRSQKKAVSKYSTKVGLQVRLAAGAGLLLVSIFELL